MEGWDEAKLKEVVDQKHAAEKKNATTIICKFFLEAVEKSLYGWWVDCKLCGILWRNNFEFIREGFGYVQMEVTSVCIDTHCLLDMC